MRRSASSPRSPRGTSRSTSTPSKVVAALLAGCTVILKPAPDTPLAGAIFGELAAEAGFPAGVLNVVTGKRSGRGGRDAGDRSARRPDLVHRLDRRSASASWSQGAETLKRVFLELGGKSANDRPRRRPELRTARRPVHARVPRRPGLRGAVAPAGARKPLRGSQEHPQAGLRPASATSGATSTIRRASWARWSRRSSGSASKATSTSAQRKARPCSPAATPGPTRAAAGSSSRPASSTSPTTCGSPRRRSSGRCWS